MAKKNGGNKKKNARKNNKKTTPTQSTTPSVTGSNSSSTEKLPLEQNNAIDSKVTPQIEEPKINTEPIDSEKAKSNDPKKEVLGQEETKPLEEKMGDTQENESKSQKVVPEEPQLETKATQPIVQNTDETNVAKTVPAPETKTTVAEESKPAEVKEEAAKPEQVKTEEVVESKVEEAKAEETVRSDNEAKIEEIKVQDTPKSEETQVEQLKVEEIKSEQVEAKEIKSEEVKAKEIKSEEIKSEEIKSEEIKSEEIKTEEVKSEEIKTEEVKIEVIKTEETIKESKAETTEAEVEGANTFPLHVNFGLSKTSSIRLTRLDTFVPLQRTFISIKHNYNLRREEEKRKEKKLTFPTGIKKELRENIYTIPNLLTFGRLLAAPYIGYLILERDYNMALGLFALAGFTDMVTQPIIYFYGN
ncbi:Putative Crd1/Cardiolipin synthase [Rhizopus microsporus]|nr:Putative Crd1/Cardiolipin synthase [Rhizopus microsporus]